MDVIPCHLKDTHTHLEELRNIPPENLKGNKHFSADISSLYTNLSITGSTENILKLVKEYRANVDLLGFSVKDLEELLELGLGMHFSLIRTECTFKNAVYLWVIYPAQK